MDNGARTLQWLELASTDALNDMYILEKELWTLSVHVVQAQADTFLQPKIFERLTRFVYARSSQWIAALTNSYGPRLCVVGTLRQTTPRLMLNTPFEYTKKLQSTITRLRAAPTMHAFSALVLKPIYYGYCVACQGNWSFLPIAPAVPAQNFMLFRDSNTGLPKLYDVWGLIPHWMPMSGMCTDCTRSFLCKKCKSSLSYTFQYDDLIARSEDKLCLDCVGHQLSDVEHPDFRGLSRRVAQHMALSDILF